MTTKKAGLTGFILRGAGKPNPVSDCFDAVSSQETCFQNSLAGGWGDADPIFTLVHAAMQNDAVKISIKPCPFLSRRHWTTNDTATSGQQMIKLIRPGFGQYPSFLRNPKRCHLP